GSMARNASPTRSSSTDAPLRGLGFEVADVLVQRPQLAVEPFEFLGHVTKCFHYQQIKEMSSQ
ncbi:MAG: hypothetical protein ACOCZE_10620, partial [Planctomycetota bacterium]